MSALKIFYSYSSKDEGYKDELDKSLVMLKRYDEISSWHFRKIIPGKDINSEIDFELERADIILFLVSTDFLASSYCFDIEVKRALELRQLGKAIVIPIILRSCDWKHDNSPFKNLEALPTDGIPISLWTDTDSAFDNITQHLKNVIREISSKENKTNDVEENKESKLISDNDDTETLEQAVRLLKNETNKLDYNSSKEDIESILNLRSKIYEELIEKLNEKIRQIPNITKTFPEILFNKILSSEKLDQSTISDINKIKDDVKNFHWYNRKLIINSLTISLINHKVLDPKKIYFLLDFLTSFEEHVWESALVGLSISLIHNQNKLLRFEALRKRLETLRELDRVQKGFRLIEAIFRFHIYEKVIFNPKIFTYPFFKTVSNCFLPFYEGNSVLETAISSNNTDIDSEDFAAYIKDMPLLDSIKYDLCMALENNTIIKKDLNVTERRVIIDSLNTSYYYDPYQNYIAEYYVFFKFYPQSNITNVFDNQFLIGKTKLKGLVLNKINELQLTGNILMDEEAFQDARNKYEQILLIDPKHFTANLKIAETYFVQKHPDYVSALSYLRKNEIINDKNVHNLLFISDCYNAKKDYPNVKKYLDKVSVIDPGNKSLEIKLCQYYFDVEDYYEVLKIGLQAIVKFPNEYSLFSLLSKSYEELKDYDKMLEFVLKGMPVARESEIEELYTDLTNAYSSVFDFKNSLKYANLVYNHNPKDEGNVMTLGRTFLLSGDLDNARKYLLKASSMEQSAITNGNLGHLEFVTGNRSSALNFYEKCLNLLKDENIFKSKFYKDEMFLLNLGVTKDDYEQMVKEVVFNSKVAVNDN